MNSHLHIQLKHVYFSYFPKVPLLGQHAVVDLFVLSHFLLLTIQ